MNEPTPAEMLREAIEADNIGAPHFVSTDTQVGSTVRLRHVEFEAPDLDREGRVPQHVEAISLVEIRMNIGPTLYAVCKREHISTGRPSAWARVFCLPLKNPRAEAEARYAVAVAEVVAERLTLAGEWAFPKGAA